jgi:ketol-acid reductoisomerase
VSRVSDRLADARIAILGFGNQGSAHAQNLRASGCRIVVGARPDGDGARRARALGFETLPLADALRAADVATIVLPDEVLPSLWPELSGSARDDIALVFAHGFNLLYGDLELPARGDVVLVSPASPGAVLAGARERGENVSAYLAVHRDRSGRAEALARTYAERLGCTPLWPTTVREETEVDLFGEQAVLCGGMNALVLAAFETLVDRGYAPEIAYLECVHQLRYLAELLHARGPEGFREAISGTARFGDLTRGHRIIGPETRAAMGAVLDEIRSGAFALEWQAEVADGSPHVREAMARVSRHPIEAARQRALGLVPRAPENPARR